MSKKHSQEPPKRERERLLDVLFGSDDDMDDDLAEDYLEEYAIDPPQLVVSFKECVKKELKRIHEETGEVSASLSATLRSINGYLREEEPERIDPKTWIGSLLAGNTQPGVQAMMSFRNLTEGQVSSKDKSIIDTLKAELENDKE